MTEEQGKKIAGETKKCAKCQMDIPVKAEKCPYCQSEQVNMKNWGIGCGIFIVIVIIAVIIGSCSGGGKPSGPLPMVDISASKDAQFEQAEKLKNDAFAIAKQFSLKFLKSPDSAKFQPQTVGSVMWWGDNKFVVTVAVDSQNSFGAMIRSNIMLEVEYVGDGNWKLLDAGTPEEIMTRIAPAMVEAARPASDN
ncbi:MAG: hypothetical protein VB042_08565 [Victivallaceae bacterium]|nr:hypothetical protein [Victivallaceae bacterium]